ncbi:MAG: hypothetical protein K6T31_09675, partial [Alicyclobacillus sp.]|nr:hypothetical protein [Alicyclobacillus sp.]
LKTSAWLHACLAALGMYGYGWQLTRSRSAACLAAGSFATCGFLLGHQIHTQMFDAFCWAPWAAWAAERLLNAPAPRWPAGCRLAVPLALAVLAGHPQAVFQILVWLALQTGTALLIRPRPWRGALAVAAGTLLGLGLAAPQWLPTLALVRYSDRIHPDPAFLLAGSFPLVGWLQLLTPVGDAFQPASLEALQWLVGSRLFWEYTCYAGLMTLLLAVAAVGGLCRPAGPVLRLAVQAGVSALLALGDEGPLSAWLVHAPGFNLFRIPARYTGLLDLSLAALAALALARLAAATPTLFQRLRRWLHGAALAALAALAAGWWAGPLRSAPAWALAAAAATCALLGLAVNLPLPRRWLGPLVAGLAVADSTVHAALLAPFVLVPAAPYAHPSAAVRYVREHLSRSADPYGKVAALGETSLAYDQAAAFQIPAINGYDSLVPDWYDRYVALTWNDWT